MYNDDLCYCFLSIHMVLFNKSISHIQIEFKLKFFTFIKYSFFDNQSNNKIRE
jgi:hypothetical protein